MHFFLKIGLIRIFDQKNLKTTNSLEKHKMYILTLNKTTVKISAHFSLNVAVLAI